MPPSTPTKGDTLLVYVQPRASQSEVAGLHGDAVRIRLAAAPIDGEANEELVRFLARALKVPRARVRIVAGATSRRKRVRVAGATPTDIWAKLGLP